MQETIIRIKSLVNLFSASQVPAVLKRMYLLVPFLTKWKLKMHGNT